MKRRLTLLAAALLAMPLVHRLLEGEGSHPFRSSLALLPAVLAATHAFEGWMRARGLSGLRRREAAFVGAALVALTVASLRWQSLGLPVADRLLATAWVLLLAFWLARTVQRLRPLLGERLPRRPGAAFFWLPLIVYAALVPWTSEQRAPDGDEPYNLLIAHSLAFDLDAELSNNYARGHWRSFLDREIAPQRGDPVGPEGQVYSRHNLLLPLLLAGPYRLAGKYGAIAVMIVLSAALAWLTLRLAHLYFAERPGEALLAYCILAFAPPLLVYSSQLWVEVPAALLVVIALDRVLTLPRHRPGMGHIAAIAIPLLLLPLVKIRLMLLSGSTLLLVWLRSRRTWRATLLLGGMVALVGGAILVHNQLRFGNPLKVHSIEELNLTAQPLQRYARGLTGLFFDAAFGLFASAPVWLLLVPAAGALLWRRHRLALHVIVLAFPYLALVAPRSEWYGGWSPPFRYGVAFLPLLAVALIPALEARERLLPRACLAAFAGATLVLTLLWVVAPGWTYNWADGSSRVLDHLAAHFQIDIGRIFPSYVRPRTAAVVWPLATLALAIVWWLPGFSRRSAPALGTTVLLAAFAGAAVAAALLPTVKVEVEDAFVEKTGGELYPPLWTADRWRYRGAWLLPEGEAVRIPVSAGGSRVEVEIEARFLRRRPPPMTLVLRCGDRELARRRFHVSTEWTRERFGPFPWPNGTPLILSATGPGNPPDEKRHRILLDRVRLLWK